MKNAPLLIGEDVTILEKNIWATNQDGWIGFDKVRTSRGLEGYVFDRYTGSGFFGATHGLYSVPSAETGASRTVTQDESITLWQDRELPQSELSKLSGRAFIDTASGILVVDLYNGSSWTISEITVLMTVSQRGKHKTWNPILTRAYRLTNPYSDYPLNSVLDAPMSSGPLSNEKIGAYIGFTLKYNQRFEWRIQAAKGRPV
jgi:hypothetical protein